MAGTQVRLWRCQLCRNSSSHQALTPPAMALLSLHGCWWTPLSWAVFTHQAERGDSESRGDVWKSRAYMLIADRTDPQNPVRTSVRCGWQYFTILNLSMVDPHTSEVISVAKGQRGRDRDVSPSCKPLNPTTRTAWSREG